MQRATHPEHIEIPLAQESQSFLTLGEQLRRSVLLVLVYALGRGMKNLTSESPLSPGSASVMAIAT